MMPLMKHTLRAAMLLAGLTLLASARAATLDIAAQPLDAALAELAEDTGVQLIYDATITAGKRSPALSGDYAIDQALTRLLAGSGLRHRRNDDGSVTLEPAPTTSGTLAPVAVSAQVATKIDTPTLETPQTINVVRREQVEEQGSETVQQALRYTPGVFTEQIGASQRYDYVVLRGFS
ncbi:MAG: secretin and TonB N-terminal domain-containing protein, partial [Alcanivorax sp.]